MENEAQTAAYLNQGQMAARLAVHREMAAKAEEEKKKAKTSSVVGKKLKISSMLLRLAWYSLIPTWGLTIIYIDVHVLLHALLGDKFCRLGDEWSGVGQAANRTMRIVEPMILLFVNFIYWTIIFAALAFLVMIAGWMGASLWGSLIWIWNAVGALGYGIFEVVIDLFF